MTKVRNELEEVGQEAVTIARWALICLIDALFVGLWVILQWGLQQFIQRFPLSGVDGWVLAVFQFLFAATTLAPVIFHIMGSISIRAIKTFRQVRTELRGISDEE